MADVEMPDVETQPSNKGKAVARSSKPGGSAGAGADGKKRFEVKKVGDTRLWIGVELTDLVERGVSLGVGYCCR